MRDFDFVMFEHDVLVGLGQLQQDLFSGMASNSVVSGFAVSAATPASLTITLGPGRIYSLAFPDPTSVGSIPQDISALSCMQGANPAQSLTLTPPSAGQSQWNLIQVQFSPVDIVRPGDPNGGIVPFYNSTNPTVPNTASIATVRQHRAVIQVVQGAAATTGSEAPPQPTNGWTPLYLIDLVGGQSAITVNQVLPAAPSVGTNVPSNYPAAPFLAGFQASHHNGRPGQAPKINLASEVQGILPAANLPPNILTGQFPTVRQVLTGNITIYASPSGSDSNNGLTSSAPFASIQAALNSVYKNYDLAGYQVTISATSGTYGSISMSAMPTGAIPTNVPITISGAGAGTIISGVNVNAINVTSGAVLAIKNLTVTATGTIAANTGSGLFTSNGGIISFGSGLTFSTCGGAHMLSNLSGFISTNGVAYAVTGSAYVHVQGGLSGLVSSDGSAVTLSGTPGFAFAYAVVSQGGQISAIGQTFTGSATGPKYLANLNGVINTSGAGANYFPGNSGGYTATGGQYN